MNRTMTRYEYRITQSRHTIEGCTYTVYGMAIYQRDHADLPTLLVREVPNISLSQSRVAELVSNCNRLQPSLIHLDDIVEDYLP